MLEFAASHQRREEWSLRVTTPNLAARVVATDLMNFGPTEITLEAGRRSTSSWGFDRLDMADHLERLASQVSDSFDPELGAHLDRTIRTARRQRPAPSNAASQLLPACSSIASRPINEPCTP